MIPGPGALITADYLHMAPIQQYTVANDSGMLQIKFKNMHSNYNTFCITYSTASPISGTHKMLYITQDAWGSFHLYAKYMNDGVSTQGNCTYQTIQLQHVYVHMYILCKRVKYVCGAVWMLVFPYITSGRGRPQQEVMSEASVQSVCVHHTNHTITLHTLGLFVSAAHRQGLGNTQVTVSLRLCLTKTVSLRLCLTKTLSH